MATALTQTETANQTPPKAELRGETNKWLCNISFIVSSAAEELYGHDTFFLLICNALCGDKKNMYNLINYFIYLFILFHFLGAEGRGVEAGEKWGKETALVDRTQSSKI